MKILNNTHYYSICNRTYNIVPDNDSWQFQSSKRLSYSQRLYWEYKFVRSVGGQAFFYTFTYNNDNLPYFEFDKKVYNNQTGLYEVQHIKNACFNYDHIRLITNGLISKTLRRKYGSQLRYFVACERGEGKGKHRAKGQNPHYHVIFFISPLPENIRKPKDPPYRRISPIQFCHLCKCVWQYQSVPDSYDHLVADYKSARFGHCEPGNDVGFITDFDALSYVSKYVCKDSLQMYDDICVKDYYTDFFIEKGYTWHSLYAYYLYLRSIGAVHSRQDFLELSKLGVYYDFRFQTGRRDLSWIDFFTLNYPEDSAGFLAGFKSYFKDSYLPSVIDQSYRNYINQYGSKVRTSKSLGIYGIQFVSDVTSNPHFVLDKSDEVVTQPICLYYYRKLYMDVVRCPHSGNPLYVLNQAGLDLKCLFLRSNLDKLKRQVYDCLDFIDSNISSKPFLEFINNRDLSLESYRQMRLRSCLSDVIDRFVVYRFVYQYRYYSIFDLDPQPSLSSGFTYDNIVSDYRRFLQSNFYTCDYSDLRLVTFMELKRNFHFVSFSSHSAFSSYIDDFDILEGFFDVFRDFMSEIKKKEFEDSQVLRQKLNAVKYSSVNSL